MTARNTRVTLVHGTFAKRAKWTREGSRMWTQLNDAGYSCRTFTWSAWNSHRARARAVDQLAADLHSQHEARPDMSLAVVAHSHGGNVAVHAAHRLHGNGGPQVRVVTLATPFLFASPARFHYSFVIAAVMAAIATAVVKLPYWYSQMVHGVPDPTTLGYPYIDASTSTEVLFWTMLSVMVLHLLGLCYWLFTRGGLNKLARQRFIESVQCPAGGDALLVIRAAGDEAGFTLAFAQLSSWLSATALRLSLPKVWVPTYVLAGMALSVLPMIGSTLVVMLDVLGLFAFVVVSLPAVVNALTHGPDGITGSLFAFVSAEATPPGQYVVRQRSIADAGNRGLAHSSLYDDDRVIAWVVEHLKVSDTRR